MSAILSDIGCFDFLPGGSDTDTGAGAGAGEGSVSDLDSSWSTAFCWCCFWLLLLSSFSTCCSSVISANSSSAARFAISHRLRRLRAVFVSLPADKGMWCLHSQATEVKHNSIDDVWWTFLQCFCFHYSFATSIIIIN